jgi:hypothetical protein
MTECSASEFVFEGPGRRDVVARFDGGDIVSDGGSILLRETEARTGILGRFATCFRDYRRADRIEHTVEEMVTQRVLGLCLGWEDLNDHDELRHDPLLATLAGKREPKEMPLASSSTLNRLELGGSAIGADERYKKIALDFDVVDGLLVEAFLEAYESPPEEIVLDLDATDDPLHGRQEGRFFHGFYDCYCYLPLYIFSGEHLLCARLRRSNIDGAKGALEETQRIVAQIRESWPKTKITLRADSGFCRDSLMTWCEDEGVEYVFGIARNPRLVRRIDGALGIAQMEHAGTGKPARVYRELTYRTRKTWSRKRRVVAKAEHSSKGDNPRFVVTSLSKHEIEAKELYEELYCARGDMENRIKEQQLYLYADRTSSHWMRANQIRLYFSSIAYVLMQALRRLGLEGTELAKAQCHTIRLKLLKIGAQVRVTVRKVWVHLSECYPYAEVFALAWHKLRSARLQHA